MDIAPQSISDTDNCLIWNGDLDNPNTHKDDCKPHDHSHIELDNGIEVLESPEQWDVSAKPNVPGVIWPTQR